MRKNIICSTLFIFALFLLGGCGKEAIAPTVTTTVTPEVTPSAAPSATLSPSPTAAATPTPAFFTESLLDPVIAKYVKSELNMAENEELTQELIDTVTVIDPKEYISTLSGLEFFHNLECFGAVGYVTDISVISKLPKLQIFTLAFGVNLEIPDLSQNSDLFMLVLSGCGIKEVSNLVTGTSLTTVSLNDNFITSIECLKGMKNIEYLDLAGNPILDYETLKGDKILVKAIEASYYGYYDYEEILKVERRAQEIVGELITDDMPTLQKEYIIYEYVMKIMEYGEVEGYSTPFGYGGIILGKGVCGAFADCLALLLNTAGIEAVRVVSDTHAWTMVNVDGAWYHCDATWDDSFEDCELSFFNLGEESILDVGDHVYDLNIFPKASLKDMPYEEYCEYLADVRKKTEEKPEDNGQEPENPDDYNFDFGLDTKEGYVNIGCVFSAMDYEVNSLEIRYYVNDICVETKTISPVDIKAAYDISIAMDKLGDASDVTLEYIINNDPATSWSRTYSKDGASEMHINSIYYDKDNHKFDSCILG